MSENASFEYSTRRLSRKKGERIQVKERETHTYAEKNEQPNIGFVCTVAIVG